MSDPMINLTRDWYDPVSTRLSLVDYCRMLLDGWLDERHKVAPRFTHARLTFSSDGVTVNRFKWLLLEATPDSVASEVRCDVYRPGMNTLANKLENELRALSLKISNGRLTFRFDPPAVSMDLFSSVNGEVLFAEYLVDPVAETRIFAELSKLIINRRETK